MLEDTVKTLIEQELTEGAEISIKVGTGHNPNFDKEYTDEFVALSIKFSFETDIKEIIQIKAEFELTQYLAVSAQGSLDYERKFITIKWADFDVAMNLYSQTDIKLSVLICSAEDDEYTDITEEIKEKLETEEDEDNDNLVKQLQEMLESESGDIDLFRVDILQIPIKVIPILPIIEINFELDFVVKMNFAAGISTEVSILEATQIGVTGDTREKNISSYKNNLIGGDQYSMKITACGYIGFKAGFEGGISISFCGLSKLGKVGVYVYVGAYVDLYGFTQAILSKVKGNVSASIVGGYYVEIGIFLDITLEARSDLFKIKVGTTLFSDKWPLTSFGNKDVLLSINEEELNPIYLSNNGENEASISVDSLPTLKGEYIDITTGDIFTKEIPWSKINLSFTKSNFSYDPNTQTITYKNIISPKPASEDCTVIYKYKGAYLQFNITAKLANQLYPFNETKITYYDKTLVNKDNAGKYYKATIYTCIDGNKKFYEEYDVLSGNTLSNYNLSLNPYQYVNISWNKIPHKTIITEDTEFICYAQTRQTYVAFIYYDELNNKWKTEIRACNLGEEPIAPTLPENNKAKFVQWVGKDGYNNRAYNTAPVGISKNITQEDMTKHGVFIKTTYGHDMNDVLFSYENNDRYSLYTDLMEYKDADGSQWYFKIASIYLAQYDYDDCNVSLITKDANGNISTKEYSITYYGKITSFSTYSEKIMKLKGLSNTEDGEIIYNNVWEIGEITSDMVLYVIYEPVYHIVNLYYYDTQTATNKVYKTYKILGLDNLSQLDFKGAENALIAEEGVEYVLYGFRYYDENVYRYVNETNMCTTDMDIFPFYERKVNITFDLDGGEPLQDIDDFYAESKNDYEIYLGIYCGKPADVENTYELIGWKNMTTNEIIPVGSTIKCNTPTTFKAVYGVASTKEYILQVSTLHGVLLNDKTDLLFKGSYSEYDDLLTKYSNWLPSDVRDEQNHCIYHCTNSNIDNYTLNNGSIITYTWITILDKYKLTIDANGGTIDFDDKYIVEIEWNTEFDLSAVYASKQSDNYGSYKVSAFEDEYGKQFLPTDKYLVKEDSTLKIIWQIDNYKKYTIDFYLDNKKIKTSEYAANDLITGLEKPEQAAGLVFSGWKWYNENGEIIDEYTLMPTFNIILKATTTEVYIHYIVDGVEIDKVKGYVQVENNIKEQYVKRGYTSLPWTSTDVDINNGKFIMPEKDIVISTTTSVNSYIVYYYHNNSLYKQFTYKYGEFVKLIDAPTDTGIYYAWSSDDVSLSATGFVMPDNNVTLKTVSAINKKHILYFINDELINYDIAIPGETISVYNYENISYKNMNFSGWYANGNIINSSTLIMPNDDLFVYGYYTKGNTKVNIYFDETNFITMYGSNGDIISIANPSLNNDLQGYKINGTIFDEIKITNETIINAYIQYSNKKYQISFYANDNDEAISIIYANKGEKVYLPDLPNASYEEEGQSIEGWYNFDGVEIKTDNEGKKYIIMPTQNIIFNAVNYFEESSGYNARVYINTPFINKPVFYRNYKVYSDLAPTYFDIPKINGCEFVCWQDENGNIIDGLCLSDMNGTDQIYYGIYREVQLHVITFMLNNEIYKYDYYYDYYEVQLSNANIQLSNDKAFTGWQNPSINMYETNENIAFYYEYNIELTFTDLDFVVFGYTYLTEGSYDLYYEMYKEDETLINFAMRGNEKDSFTLAKTYNNKTIGYEIKVFIETDDGFLEKDITNIVLSVTNNYYLLTLPSLLELSNAIGNVNQISHYQINAIYN